MFVVAVAVVAVSVAVFLCDCWAGKSSVSFHLLHVVFLSQHIFCKIQ